MFRMDAARVRICYLLRRECKRLAHFIGKVKNASGYEPRREFAHSVGTFAATAS